MQATVSAREEQVVEGGAPALRWLLCVDDFVGQPLRLPLGTGICGRRGACPTNVSAANDMDYSIGCLDWR